MDTAALNTWIEVSESAYRKNLGFVRRRLAPGVELAAVVKSNAYGHGWRQIAELAVRHGADSFCVHSLDEALDLRRGGFPQDVLILGHVPLARLEEAVAENFRLILYNLESARRLAEIAVRRGQQVRLHLKVETGTCRQGVEGEELSALLAFLKGQPLLELEGCSTHFANIEDTTEHGYAEQQLSRFESALSELRAAGFSPTKQHAACSAAILLFPETHFDLVRLGISQYGFFSSRETLLSYRNRHGEDGDPGLAPVLSWKARISQVKNLPPDALVGYGGTYQTTRPTRLAILPVGYADGYDRGLGNQGHVLVRGRRAPVRGRICMNLTMVDVTDIEGVTLEDEAVLIGRQGKQEVTAQQLAGLAGTIPYEIVSRLAEHLPRLVVP
jgi:alanine racemase